MPAPSRKPQHRHRTTGLISGLIALALCRPVAAVVPPDEAARQLMDTAEQRYPQVFPGHAPTLSLPPFVYRHYPASGSYLGVVLDAGTAYQRNGVYVMGGGFGTEPTFVGVVTDFIEPVDAPQSARIAAGAGFMLALHANGTLLSWGRGDGGGVIRALAGPPAPGSTATPLPSLAGTAAVGSNGGNNQAYPAATSAAIGGDGRVRVFGDLGLAGPLEVPELAGARALAVCADSRIVALRANGTLALSWRESITPYRRGATDLPGIAEVTWLTPHVNVLCNPLVLTADGSAWRLAPQAPIPQASPWAAPPQRVAGLPPLVQAACGLSSADDETCLGLTRDGQVWSWGDNNYGTRGTGDAQPRPMPAPAPGPVVGLPRIRQVAAGFGVSLALAEDGRLFTWGVNLLGRLPAGSSTDERLRNGYLPGLVGGLGPIAEVAVNGGSTQALARLQDGSVWTWGDNQFGQLGIAAGQPNPGNQSATPVPASGVLLE